MQRVELKLRSRVSRMNALPHAGIGKTRAISRLLIGSKKCGNRRHRRKECLDSAQVVGELTNLNEHGFGRVVEVPQELNCSETSIQRLAACVDLGNSVMRIRQSEDLPQGGATSIEVLRDRKVSRFRPFSDLCRIPELFGREFLKGLVSGRRRFLDVPIIGELHEHVAGALQDLLRNLGVFQYKL